MSKLKEFEDFSQLIKNHLTETLDYSSGDYSSVNRLKSFLVNYFYNDPEDILNKNAFGGEIEFHYLCQPNYRSIAKVITPSRYNSLTWLTNEVVEYLSEKIFTLILTNDEMKFSDINFARISLREDMLKTTSLIARYLIRDEAKSVSKEEELSLTKWLVEKMYQEELDIEDMMSVAVEDDEAIDKTYALDDENVFRCSPREFKGLIEEMIEEVKEHPKLVSEKEKLEEYQLAVKAVTYLKAIVYVITRAALDVKSNFYGLRKQIVAPTGRETIVRYCSIRFREVVSYEAIKEFPSIVPDFKVWDTENKRLNELMRGTEYGETGCGFEF